MSQVIDESWYRRPSGVPERTSAGGVIARFQKGRVYVALVREVGLPSYVLPKGGVEQNESLEEAARREIEEEAGISRLELIEKLGVGERLDYGKKNWLRAHYFLFATDQVEGAATDAAHNYGLRWFLIDELPPMFWPEQKELIESNRQKIVRLMALRAGLAP